MRFISDANSLIYLAKTGLLGPFLEVSQVFLPQTVLDECLEKSSQHSDASEIDHAVHAHLIQVVEDGPASALLPKMGKGEKAVLNLFKPEMADWILTDDGEAVKYCRRHQLPLFSSPFVPALLFQKNKIHLGPALQAIQHLSKIGYFSNEVIFQARQALLGSQRLKGILFDMDGVLVDSMKYHDEAWRITLRGYGLEISKEEIYRREGQKGHHTARDLLIQAGHQADEEKIQKLIKEKEIHFKKTVKASLFPKALECVQKLYREGFSLAVVTGSFSAEVKNILPDEMLRCFGTSVTADRVQIGKPHPEPYLLALAELGISAQDALVIENAPFGIQAAKAAGAACIALATSLPEAHLQEADMVLPGLEDLAEYFESLIRKDISIAK
jgi:beta-phosphoglucomutase